MLLFLLLRRLEEGAPLTSDCHSFQCLILAHLELGKNGLCAAGGGFLLDNILDVIAAVDEKERSSSLELEMHQAFYCLFGLPPMVSWEQ